MTTLQSKIEALQAQNQKDVERKIRELTIKEQMSELTGLDFMVLIHSGKNESTSIWVENSRYDSAAKFDRTKIKEYYDKICTVFTPVCKQLTFASSKTIENFAPAKLEFENNTSEIVFYHEQTVKFAFHFEGNITVTFKMPFINDGSVIDKNLTGVFYFDLKPGRKNPMTKKCYYLNKYGRVNMYGNNYYAYCVAPEWVKEFMNVIFYGTDNPIN